MKLSFVVSGNPVPKARARKGKGGHWHTPQKTIDYEHAIGWAARGAQLKQQLRWPLDAEYKIMIKMVFKDRRRRDADNVFKAVLDGCNKVLWDDDMQVKVGSWLVEVDAKNPRLEVEVEVL